MTVACLRKAWRRCRRGAWRRRTALARTETVHSLPKSSTPARSLPVRAADHASHCGRPIGLRCLSRFKRRGAAGRGRHDVHLSARAHDLAHHRRLRYDGTRRRGRGDRAVFFGSASRAPVSAPMSTTFLRFLASRNSALDNSTYATTAASGSIRRRPTTRRSPMQCSTCCRISSQEDKHIDDLLQSG